MRLHMRRVVTGAALLLCGGFLLLAFTPGGPSDIDGGPVQFLDDSKYARFTVNIKDRVHPVPPKNQPFNQLNVKKPDNNNNNNNNNKDTSSIELPQYAGGRDFPLRLFPDPHEPHDDRILHQMRYVPPGVLDKDPELEESIKTIYVPGGSSTPMGRRKFQQDNCPVDMCWLTQSARWRHKADAVLFQNEYFYDVMDRPEHQIWVLWLLESPFHSGPLKALNGMLNWTATYRADSTIVTPYEKFVHFSNYTTLPVKPDKNYAAGKKKLLAWFVSNCSARNKRWEYMQALKMYGIDVHIYGDCGDMKCDRFEDGLCDSMLKQEYKFYLSFENSNCEYYITEKFFHNAFMNDVVPIAMGGRREDYAAASPPNSYIFVEDFESPKQLAELLLKLDRDDDLYNQYFRWKNTGEFINTKFWCRLCSMIHGTDEVMESRKKGRKQGVKTRTGSGSGLFKRQWYDDVEGWWRGNGTCTYNRWDNKKAHIYDWEEAMNGLY